MSEITLSKLGVCNDAITIEFSGTKTDTDGQTTNTKEPRHCYANPHNWRTCIVTWIGIYFLCNPLLHTSSMAAGARDCHEFLYLYLRNLDLFKFKCKVGAFCICWVAALFQLPE